MLAVIFFIVDYLADVDSKVRVLSEEIHKPVVHTKSGKSSFTTLPDQLSYCCRRVLGVSLIVIKLVEP